MSGDKDMRQIPGKHLCMNRDKKFTAEDPGWLELYKKKNQRDWAITGTGFKWFCAQMLLGDIVDNVKGAPRYGPKRVADALDSLISHGEIWDRVTRIYGECNVINRLDVNAQMLWILREEGGYFDEDRV